MRGIHALNKLNPLEQDWLVKSFAELTKSVDIVLIDTAMTGTTHVLPLSLASEQVMIVISGSAASLTGAYVLIKIMSQEYSKQHFLILVNKVDSETESLSIYQNLYKVARQYLSVTLEYIGYIQSDENYAIQRNYADRCLKYSRFRKLHYVLNIWLGMFCVLHARINTTGSR